MNSDLTPAAGPPQLTPLALLAAHLTDHRESILQSWDEAVAADADLAGADDPARAEFRAHLRLVLDEFAASLRREDVSGAAPADDPGGRGEHHWRQGHDLRAVILRWGHLHRCVLDALEAAPHGGSSALAGGVMAPARRALATLVHRHAADNVEQIALRQQKDSLQIRQDLERVVANSVQAGRQRATLWSAAAHGLRGQLSIITSATTLLDDPDLDAASRAETIQMLQRGTAALKHMLRDALENLQTEAVREELQVTSFDASALLDGLCAASQPLAREHRLSLRAEGPGGLRVEGDRGKILRIAQSLLLDALSRASGGGVAVSWQADDDAWWSFRVRDAGPGLPPAGDPARHDAARPEGEGFGPDIVRRLVAILGGRMETTSDVGIAVTVLLPRR